MDIHNLLYLKDCYMREFDATVVEVLKDDSGIWIELDQTGFYATSGGQPFDKGKIIHGNDAYEVSEVKKADGKVLHKVDKEGLVAGSKIHGMIDWERRYKLMRYHTAMHILCAVVEKETGAIISGNNIDIDKAKMDFTLDNFDRNQLMSYQEKVNEIVKKAIPLHFSILPREEAFKIPSIVKLKMAFPEEIKDIRVVEVENWDTQACGGTHLHNTSEIKGIQIYDLENKGKGRKRIYFRLVD
jgi:misacylated tRNA(Ala) deacylase